MKKLVILSAPCGVGKSTIIDALNEENVLKDYMCLDSDELGLNWWDYAGTEQEEHFSEDCLKEAVKKSGNKNILLGSCLNPYDYYSKVVIPEEVEATYFVGMVCSDEEIRYRLKARPEERMCGSDEFIDGQIQYSAWYKTNRGKFQLFLDNSDMEISRTAELIAEFVKKL